ncbi:hypothetical protein Tco_1192275 [Tanacetum coccineum]
MAGGGLCIASLVGSHDVVANSIDSCRVIVRCLGLNKEQLWKPALNLTVSFAVDLNSSSERDVVVFLFLDTYVPVGISLSGFLDALNFSRAIFLFVVLWDLILILSEARGFNFGAHFMCLNHIDGDVHISDPPTDKWSADLHSKIWDIHTLSLCVASEKDDLAQPCSVSRPGDTIESIFHRKHKGHLLVVYKSILDSCELCVIQWRDGTPECLRLKFNSFITLSYVPWLRHVIMTDMCRYKARLVANGSNQLCSIGPVLLLDVKNALLYGCYQRMFMHQTSWFPGIRSIQIMFAFSRDRDRPAPTCFCYVDDIVLTVSSSDLSSAVIITSLHAEFSMTDLGHALNYCLAHLCDLVMFLGCFCVSNKSMRLSS